MIGWTWIHLNKGELVMGQAVSYQNALLARYASQTDVSLDDRRMQILARLQTSPFPKPEQRQDLRSELDNIHGVLAIREVQVGKVS